MRRRAQREKVRVCAYGEVLSVQRSRWSLAARFDQGRKCPLCKAQRVRAGASRGVLVFWQTRGCRPLMWTGIPERHIHCVQNHLFTKGVGGSARPGEMVGAVNGRLQVFFWQAKCIQIIEAHGAGCIKSGTQIDKVRACTRKGGLF